MIILLTGAGGMLGQDVAAQLGDLHTLHTASRTMLDIADFKTVQQQVAALRPDLIINCAATTNVDACETDLDGALAGNALGPRNLALAADAHNAALLHISTDYVFDGNAKRPYTEFDPVAPVTAYGRSKLAGEEQIRIHCRRHYIVRTAWLYGAHGPNFVTTMLRLAAEKDRLTVVNDQIGNPTWTADLARVIARLIETGAYGTYHATAEGQTSWHGFTEEIFRLKGITIPVDPVGSDAFVRPAKRPAFSGLDNSCLRALGITMPRWDKALANYFASIDQSPERADG